MVNLFSNSALWDNSFSKQRLAVSTWEGVISRRLPPRLPLSLGALRLPAASFNGFIRACANSSVKSSSGPSREKWGSACLCVLRGGERGRRGRKCYSVLCLFNNFFLIQLAEQHIIRGLVEQA